MSEPKSKDKKSFRIYKRVVWEAWRQVRANQGAAGIDEESITEFEGNLEGNLYKVWNRLSSGSYMPPPVRAVADTEEAGRVENARRAHRRGQGRADGRVAVLGARGGAGLPPRLLWVSAGTVGP